MKLSIIILTWNSEKYIDNCINSIYNGSQMTDFEILLIDNGSKDKTLQKIEEKYSEIKLIKNKINRGIAPARNQGIKEAKGDYILILDIDTVVKDDSILKMMEFMEQHTEIGICGPKLVYQDGSLQSSCRRFPLVQTKFLRRFPMKVFEKYLKEELYCGRFEDKVGYWDVDYVIGACQMIRKKAFEDTGLLDERIFYGPEDVDLCLRMWLKGWKVIYYTEACIIHFEQRITKKRLVSKVSLKHVEGLIYYFFKHGYFFSRRGIYRRIGL